MAILFYVGLHHPALRALLHSADSMAWSAAARWEGRYANDWREAERFRHDIEHEMPRRFWQLEIQLAAHLM